MVGEPLHVKQLSLNHVFKIGLKILNSLRISNWLTAVLIKKKTVKTFLIKKKTVKASV
jgi:hypothetical protein